MKDLAYYYANSTQNVTLPCMFSGYLWSYVDTNPIYNNLMFFWMYLADDYKNAPLIFWLDGGPGRSSQFGNFLVNGPLKIERTGNGTDDFNVTLAPEGSWA